ncbi:MAG: SGNH/GDSL hydrolase family protein [Rickettsiales bacterium]|jgi:lysophospholipase L1-like esterase|nr:SGNH/GDSL hydrolase family protein [Rickettsiales bacterium]
MPLKVIAALGDSVTNGYWDSDTFQGWFGRLSAKITAANPPLDENGKVKKGAMKYGFNNISYDGDRVCDAFHRLSAEGCSRDIDILLICIGGNDLVRSPTPDSPTDLSEHVRAEYWHRMLDLAKKNIAQVVVLDILPRYKDDTVAYGWFDAPMHEYNSDRMICNDQIAKICAEKNIPFIRRYDKWAARDLSRYYADTSHPNAAGHSLIADEVYEELMKLKII